MTVHGPVCGMEIEPQSTFAKVGQFDKDPHHYVMTSATTGFNPQSTLTRIELPLSELPLNEHSTHPESTLHGKLIVE